MVHKVDLVQHAGEGVSMSVVKLTPPVAVSSMAVLGFHVQDWLVLLTILYTLLQIVLLLPKLVAMLRNCRR